MRLEDKWKNTSLVWNQTRLPLHYIFLESSGKNTWNERERTKWVSATEYTSQKLRRGWEWGWQEDRMTKNSEQEPHAMQCKCKWHPLTWKSSLLKRDHLIISCFFIPSLLITHLSMSFQSRFLSSSRYTRETAKITGELHGDQDDDDEKTESSQWRSKEHVSLEVKEGGIKERQG